MERIEKSILIFSSMLNNSNKGTKRKVQRRAEEVGRGEGERGRFG